VGFQAAAAASYLGYAAAIEARGGCVDFYLVIDVRSCGEAHSTKLAALYGGRVRGSVTLVQPKTQAVGAKAAMTLFSRHLERDYDALLIGRHDVKLLTDGSRWACGGPHRIGLASRCEARAWASYRRAAQCIARRLAQSLALNLTLSRAWVSSRPRSLCARPSALQVRQRRHICGTPGALCLLHRLHRQPSGCK
jgi:hypothetical protein